jgi:hypothetical protein
MRCATAGDRSVTDDKEAQLQKEFLTGLIGL